MATEVAPKALGSQDEQATLARLQGYIKECKAADDRWRKRALEGLKYYDGEQWDKDAKKEVEDRGQKATVINEIKSAVRTVKGQMLGQPFDWIAKPEGLHDDELADVGTHALKFVADRNLAMDLYKRIYQWLLCYGVGYVQVGRYVRVRDRRVEPVQFRFVDAREVRVDPTCHEPDMAGARFLDWGRRMLLSEAKRKWKKKGEQLAGQVGGADPNLDDASGPSNKNEGLVDLTPPQSMWDRLEDWNYVEKDVRDGEAAKYVIIHETWELVWEDAYLAEGADGVPVEVPGKPNSPEAVSFLFENFGGVGFPTLKKHYEDEVPRIHRHVWCGPLLLESERTNLPRIPWVRAVYELDHNGDPRSFVDSLMDLQEDLNYRNSKALYELSGRPFFVSPEVLAAMGLTVEQAAELAKDPGAVWIARPNEVGFLQRPDMTPQQMEMANAREAQIKSTSGANDDLQGAPSQSLSGRSKEITLMQGQTMQRDAEASLRLFHRLLGELVFWFIQQEHTDEWTFRITDEVGKDKFITANKLETDPQTGQPRKLNDLNAAPFEIMIDSQPWTDTLRDRTAEMFSQMLTNEEDPGQRAVIRKAVLMAANIPGKAKLMEMFDQAEQARQQQPQQAPPIRKDLTELVKIDFNTLREEERSQVLAAVGIKASPPPAGPEAAAPDPNLAPKLGADLAKHQLTLAHQAHQGALGREHEAAMAGASHAADAQHTLAGHALGLDAAQHQADLAPPAPPSGGASL